MERMTPQLSPGSAPMGETPHGQPHNTPRRLPGYCNAVKKNQAKTPGPEPDLKSVRQNERIKLEEAFVLQNELLAARDYAEEVIEAAPPLLVLDEKLCVRTANKSFFKTFKITSHQTLNCLVYEMGNGQWNLPTLRTLLEEVLPRKKSFKGFEVTHEFERIGQRTMLLSGRQVDHLQRILLFIEDITERRQVQAATEVS